MGYLRIHPTNRKFFEKGPYDRCRFPTNIGSWGLGMSLWKAQRRSRSCKNWFENRTAQGTICTTMCGFQSKAKCCKTM